MHYYILHNNDDVILKVIKPRYDSSLGKQKKKENKSCSQSRYSNAISECWVLFST